jgi:hypothetical protein
VTDTLQTLLDKQALHELALTYYRACDRRDFALVRALYHDDAIDDHGSMFSGTADEYVAWLRAVPTDRILHTAYSKCFADDRRHDHGRCSA